MKKSLREIYHSIEMPFLGFFTLLLGGIVLIIFLWAVVVVTRLVMGLA